MAPDDGLRHDGLIALMEAVGDEATVASQLEGLLPPESGIWVFSGDVAETLRGLPSRLEAHPALDVLILTGELPTKQLVDRLRAALATDSVCASVSVDPEARPLGPPIPPPSVDRPSASIVLLRRELLDLALTESPLDGPTEETAPLRRLLEIVERPGYVHRAIPGEPALVSEAPSRSRRRGTTPPRVLVDARCLEQPLSGTQTHVLGLLGGLARAAPDRIVSLAPTQIHPSAGAAVDALAQRIRFVLRDEVEPADIFHRPYQLLSLHDLAECVGFGGRLVVTHQDLILDRTPAYMSDESSWRDYRRTTAAVFETADQLGFFSTHAALDAASDGEVELDRATVIPLGVDSIEGLDSAPVVHPSLAALAGKPFLLVVGNAYAHKNRPFAFRLLERLVEAHAWDGALVLAGGHPTRGSSVAAEHAFLGQRPALRTRVLDLGHISDGEKAALYRDAALVVFPSLYEGFGLPPFEAAAAGTPAIYAWRASMREFLPRRGALPSLEVGEAAEFVASLLRDERSRAALLEEIQAAGRGLTWHTTAAGYLELYRRALERPARPVPRVLVAASPAGAKGLSRHESVVLDVYRRRPAFRAAVDGLVRVGSAATGTRRALGRRRPTK